MYVKKRLKKHRLLCHGKDFFFFFKNGSIDDNGSMDDNGRGRGGRCKAILGYVSSVGRP